MEFTNVIWFILIFIVFGMIMMVLSRFIGTRLFKFIDVLFEFFKDIFKYISKIFR